MELEGIGVGRGDYKSVCLERIFYVRVLTYDWIRVLEKISVSSAWTPLTLTIKVNYSAWGGDARTSLEAIGRLGQVEMFKWLYCVRP